MKSIAASAILGLTVVGLSACASTSGSVSPPPAGFDAAATEFTGWVRIRGEEFQLYADEMAMRAGGASPCVSGALPRDLQRAAGDIDGMKVTLFGRTRAWSERGDLARIDLQGSRVENLCSREVVIQADRVEVIR
jgi:hypothetical protein